MAMTPAMTSKMPTIAMIATPNQIQPTHPLMAGCGSGVTMTCGAGSWLGAWSGLCVPRCDVVGMVGSLFSGRRLGQLGREELEGGAGLGLLFAGEVDAAACQAGLGLGRHLERLAGRA